MTRGQIIGSRVTWWWGALLLTTAVGVALSLVAHHFWGSTTAGIIAVVFFFGVFVMFFSQFGIKPTSTPVGSESSPSRELSSPASPMLHPAAAEINSVSESRSADQSELTPHETKPSVGDPYPPTDAGDLLDKRNKLVECLADSIPDEEYIAQIADEAGLDRKHLKLDGTPSNRWFSVIRRAEVEKKERRIVERASRITPDQVLGRAIQDYIRRRND